MVLIPPTAADIRSDFRACPEQRAAALRAALWCYEAGNAMHLVAEEVSSWAARDTAINDAVWNVAEEYIDPTDGG